LYTCIKIYDHLLNKHMILLLSMPGLSEWIFLFIAFGIMLIPYFFYLLTLKKLFESISTSNRSMPADKVWLLLIPIFGTIWHFTVVNNLSSSIKAETDSRGLKIFELKPGYNIGLAMCILNCSLFIPGLNALTFIPGLICWILYWYKMNIYKKKLL